MAHVLDQKAAGTDVLTLARERMERLFDRFDHVAVACSGGKDSTIVLELAAAEAALRERLPLHVAFFDEEIVPPPTAEYMERLRERDDLLVEWFCLELKHRNACSRREPYWYPWDTDYRDVWVRDLPEWGITEPEFGEFTPKTLHTADVNQLYLDPVSMGQCVVLLGLRADESTARRWAARRHVVDNYIHPYHAGGTGTKGVRVPKGIYLAHPIYDWKLADVWLAMRKFGWDHNEAYDHMRAAGISRRDQRIAPPFGEEPSRGLWQFRTCWPEMWEKMIRRIPGAPTAARYGDTPLYAIRGLPPRRDGEHYRDYILRHLRRYPPAAQQQVKAVLQEKVRLHYNKTTDPILDTVPHPETGISWRWLAKIVLRGHFKGRTDAARSLSRNRDDPEAWEEYNAARDAWKAQKLEEVAGG